MAVTPLPFLDRTAASFKTDVDAFFAQKLPQFAVEVNQVVAAADASASAANTSKNAAASSATNAATSATNAASSATAANTSKTNAATSETNAASSASAANTSKNAAAGSATAAATSATNSEASAVRAKAAADSIASGPVTSVNSKTGVVSLSASDVGALPSGGTAAAATKLATARTINGVAFDGTANITVADGTKEPAIPAGTTAQYVRGDKTVQDFAKDVRAVAMAGLDLSLPVGVVATDNLLAAIGKLQAQMYAADDFDARLMWQFAADAEGWTASGSTLSFASKGAMTQTSSSTDPYVSSPTQLGIAGGVYGRIRAKIKRIAGSGWDGTAYYVTSGHGIGSGNRCTIPNPNIAIGQTQIVEWDMWNLTAGGDDWYNSVINQLRIDLGVTAADVFDIDWIAVGRAGPNFTQIVGPVSRGSSGILTGAVMERNSNSNGEYTKLADGTMIARQRLDPGSFAAGASSAVVWTYPVAFAAPPIVGNSVCTQGGYGFAMSAGLEDPPTASSASISFQNGYTATKFIVLYLTAVGRWY